MNIRLVRHNSIHGSGSVLIEFKPGHRTVLVGVKKTKSYHVPLPYTYLMVQYTLSFDRYYLTHCQAYWTKTPLDYNLPSSYRCRMTAFPQTCMAEIDELKNCRSLRELIDRSANCFWSSRFYGSIKTINYRDGHFCRSWNSWQAMSMEEIMSFHGTRMLPVGPLSADLWINPGNPSEEKLEAFIRKLTAADT